MEPAPPSSLSSRLAALAAVVAHLAVRPEVVDRGHVLLVRAITEDLAQLERDLAVQAERNRPGFPELAAAARRDAEAARRARGEVRP